MDNYENELREKWNKINYREGGALQLEVDHPLEWYVRYETPEMKSVVVVCDKPVENLPASRSIDISCRQRKDGRYTISLTLIEHEQEDVFIAMAADIIQFSKAPGADEAIRKFIKRYNAWRQLLDHKHSALLSAEAQKGLIGELLFLKEKLEENMSPMDAVLGWVGPENADQDFSYTDGWHEIKTVGASASFVSISSVEQLDSDTEGELVVFRIDKCAPAQPEAFTLYKLVHVIYDLLAADPAAADCFTLKLGAVGYIDMNGYDRQHYRFAFKQTYCVDEAFPRFRRESIQSEIVNVSYQISLPSIERWIKQGG